MLAKYPLDADTYKVELDCSQSNIQLGLLLEAGPDDRPRVKTIRPGGNAKGKVNVGDVVLATTYTVLKGVRDESWGSSMRGWLDTAETTSDASRSGDDDQLVVRRFDHVPQLQSHRVEEGQRGRRHALVGGARRRRGARQARAIILRAPSHTRRAPSGR